VGYLSLEAKEAEAENGDGRRYGLVARKGACDCLAPLAVPVRLTGRRSLENNQKTLFWLKAK